MEQLAPVGTIYEEHKETLDDFWDRICSEAKRRNCVDNCWNFNVGSMELNKDGYWKYRWNGMLKLEQRGKG
jgi:hypothetical protein